MKTSGFTSLIYNSNPFYLISACVALYGIRHAQTSLGLDDEPWMLAVIFAGYSTVMALTAFLIVRIGRVWDDARSIFMVLLLMAFALSTSFDHLCVDQLKLATLMLGGGFLFTVLLSEGLMLSLKMKMPAVYRVPLYVVLAIIFCYPLLFGVRARWFPEWDIRWMIILFPIAAALGLLILIPAARLGRRSIRETGTPWKWPLYPLSLFVLLTVGIVGKAYLLCMAFDPTYRESTIFAPYFLAPIALAITWLWFEYSAKNDVGNIGAPMFWAAMTLPLCFAGTTSSSAVDFQLYIANTIASPTSITIVVLLAMYFSAWWRGLDKQGVALSIMLVGSVFAHPNMIGFSIHHLNEWPLFALAGFQLIRSRPSLWSRRVFDAMMWTLLGFAVFTYQSQYHEHTMIVAIHGLLAAFLVVGVLFHDRLAEQMRLLAVAGIILLTTATAVIGATQMVPIEICWAESATLGLIALLGWWAAKDRLFAYALISCVLMGGLPNAFRMIVDQVGPKSDRTMVLLIFGAVVCFILGVGISSLKAGLSNVARNEIKNLIKDAKLRFQPVEGVVKD